MLRPSRRYLISRPPFQGTLPLVIRSSLATLPRSDDPETIKPLPTTSSPPILFKSRLKSSLPRLRALASRTGVPLPSLAISFLVLHELTALVPLVIFFFVFQALGAGAGILSWIASLSTGIADESKGGRGRDWRGLVGRWYEEGEKRVERVGKRYGILGYDKTSKPTGETIGEEDSAFDLDISGSTAAQRVADAIAAYVVVKALLPIRIGVSIGAAPAFARLALEPMRRIAGRIKIRRGKG